MAQEALVAGWHRLEQFRGESEFSTWMYRIVTRLALNRLQRTKATENLDLLGDVAADADVRSSPERAVERNLAVDAVTAAIEQLPIPQRIVIVLSHFEDLSYEQIATVTKSTVPAVRSHLFRARRTLALTLGDWR